MQQKKRKKRKNPSAPPISSTDESFVASLLEKIESEEPFRIIAQIKSPLIARTFIERIPLKGEATVAILRLFQNEFKDKDVQKAIKRTLFRLESKGVSVEREIDSDPGSSPIFRPVEKETPGVVIGPVADSFGFRAVLITLNRNVKGQDLAVGIISDEKGIQEFLFGNFSRKRVREIKAEIEENAGPLVETTLSHAAAVLETAYKCHKMSEHHNTISPDFVEFRSVLLGMVPEPGRRDFVGCLPQLLESEETITQSGLLQLFEKVTMKNWIIDLETLTPYLEEFLKVDESPLVLSESQKHDRMREIKTKATNDIFPAVRRALLRDRLEEMSYFFAKLGDERSSRLALAASRSIEDNGPILRQNPVLEFIVESSFSFYGKGIISEEENKEGINI